MAGDCRRRSRYAALRATSSESLCFRECKVTRVLGAGMPGLWRSATLWFALAVSVFQLSQMPFEQGWFHTCESESVRYTLRLDRQTPRCIWFSIEFLGTECIPNNK
jgi:hypothetical protein